jgi:hypothetical protein
MSVGYLEGLFLALYERQLMDLILQLLDSVLQLVRSRLLPLPVPNT